MFWFLLACFPELEYQNFPPTLEILSPENEAVFNEGETIIVEAYVTDEELKQGGVSVQWQSDIDGLLLEILPNSDGSVSLSSQKLSPGQHNTVIIVEDTEGDFIILKSSDEDGDKLTYSAFSDTADMVVTISKVTDEIVKNVAPDVESIYHPHTVDTNVFKPLQEAEEVEFKNQLFKSNKDKVVFF